MAPTPAPKPAPKPPAPAPGGIPSNSPLLQPSQQLSGQPLLQSAQQLASAQTQGPLTQLAKQIAQNQAQGAAAQKQTFGYYMTLAKQAQDSLNQEKMIGAGLNSQLSQIGQETGNAIGGFGQQAQSGALGRMAGMGLDAGQSQALWNETARQNQIGALNAGAFRSAGANQGANYQGAAASNLGTFALRGQERLGDIGRATQLANVPLSTKQATLMANQGALTSTALGQLRDRERSFMVAQQGLGVKAASITAANARNAANNATSRANNAATNATSASNNALTNQTSAQNNAANNATRVAIGRGMQNLHGGGSGGGGGGGAKPLSTFDNNKVLGMLNRLENAITTMQRQGIQTKQPNGTITTNKSPTEAQIRQALSTVDSTGGVLTQAAYELNGWGKLTPATAAQLHQMGVRGGSFRGAPIQVGGTGVPGVHITPPSIHIP